MIAMYDCYNYQKLINRLWKSKPTETKKLKG